MEILNNSDKFYFFLRKFKALLQYQYNIKEFALKFFDENNLSFILSKKTGRLKYVYYDNKIIATFRAHDGFIVFSNYGANLILKLIDYPKMRVVIPSDISEFISKGRNVFAKHILKIDNELRPESEVFIVDPDDNLIALGKLILNKNEIFQFKSGVAVKVR